MASVSIERKEQKKTEFLTCRQVLNIMVIFGFMVNYMLRVNLTIAIVDMVVPTNNNYTNSSTPDLHIDDGMKFNWNSEQKNAILGSFFWGYVLTELPGGRMAEVFGARKIFGGGMLMAAILTLLTPASCYVSYYAILILRAILGFFLGATWPAMPPMAANWIPPMERSKFIANMMASSLGAALTMPLSGFLISNFGWSSVFYVTGVIGLVWSILWFALVYDSPAHHPRITEEERFDIETKIAAGQGGKTLKPTSVPWKQLLLSAPVWAIIITHGLSVFGYFTIVNQLPTYMKDVLHFNIKENGLLSSLPYLGKYIMAILASYLADKLRKSGKLSTTATRKLFTTFASLVPGILMLIEVFWGMDATISITIFTASLFFNGAVTAGYLANGLDIAPNFSGTIMGLANTLSSFGGWLSTKIVAVLTYKESSFNTWKYVFWMLVFTYICGAIVFLILGSGKLQKWNSGDPYQDSKEMQPLKTDKRKQEIEKQHNNI